jgi:hypothetical protein
MAHHNDMSSDSRFFKRVKHEVYHRPPNDRTEHFGKIALHARPLSGSQNHSTSFIHPNQTAFRT